MKRTQLAAAAATVILIALGISCQGPAQSRISGEWYGSWGGTPGALKLTFSPDGTWDAVIEQGGQTIKPSGSPEFNAKVKRWSLAGDNLALSDGETVVKTYTVSFDGDMMNFKESYWCDFGPFRKAGSYGPPPAEGGQALDPIGGTSVPSAEETGSGGQK